LNQQNPPPTSNNGASQPEFKGNTSFQQSSVQTRVPIKLPNIRPVITNTLVGVTVFIFLLQIGSQYFLQNDYPAFYGVKNNQMIAQGQLWRLFTPMFLHGSILHIAFNMFALLKLGPGLERYYGHWRFLALYILCGFGGNVFSMMFTNVSSLGSSTAIFGLIGAQGVFFYHNRKIFGANYRQALNGIIMIATVNLIIGISPGIDNWGHIGGLIGGVVFAWIGGPILDVTGVYPNLILADQRQASDAWQAIGVVAIFFSALAAGALYLMR
jgi:rhomboid protease GluP